MSAEIITFPVIARPVPIQLNPIYWKGVEDFMAEQIRARHRRTEAEARCEAQEIIALSFAEYPLRASDGLPVNVGEGEC